MAFETRQALEKVLARWAELIENDAALLDASRGKHLTVSMEFPDLEAFFYTRLDDGRIQAGVGQPEGEATIELVLDSEVFEEVFTGRLNPAKAAMKGDLAFSGNVSAAMKFQGVLSDFVRLYQQAREEAEE